MTKRKMEGGGKAPQILIEFFNGKGTIRAKKGI